MSHEKQVAVVRRVWDPGDRLELSLPMEIKVTRWFENSAGIERGPLVYALRIEEKWKEVKKEEWKHSFFEVYPESPWNYGFFESAIEKNEFIVHSREEIPDMPWNLNNAPVSIQAQAGRIPGWTLYNNSAGIIPVASRPVTSESIEIEEITLIPYGCTTLRIAEFPVLPPID